MTQAKAVKAVNYTEEQTAKVKADYAAGVSIEAIAAEMGKTTRSIVAKLSREGVYKAKDKAKAETKTNMGKADLAAEIVKVAGMTHEEAKDLTKLTKQTLVNLFAAVQKAADFEVNAEVDLEDSGEAVA